MAVRGAFARDDLGWCFPSVRRCYAIAQSGPATLSRSWSHPRDRNAVTSRLASRPPGDAVGGDLAEGEQPDLERAG